jgi:hypothetical protein
VHVSNWVKVVVTVPDARRNQDKQVIEIQGILYSRDTNTNLAIT